MFRKYLLILFINNFLHRNPISLTGYGNWVNSGFLTNFPRLCLCLKSSLSNTKPLSAVGVSVPPSICPQGLLERVLYSLCSLFISQIASGLAHVVLISEAHMLIWEI